MFHLAFQSIWHNCTTSNFIYHVLKIFFLQNGERVEGMMPIPDSHREIESAFQQLKWLTQDTEKDLSEQQQKQELFVFQYQETLRIQGKERPFCTKYF